MILILSIVVGVVIAVALFRLFFKDFADFIECVRFYFQPDIISVFRGEWAEDWWGSMKLGVWLAVSVGMGFVAHYKFDQFWGSGGEAFASEDGIEMVAARTPDEFEGEEETEAKQPGTVVGAASNTVAATPAADQPKFAKEYGIKLGDTVQISALSPAIALRRATIISMNDEQITVRSGIDDYTVRWKDVTKLKTAGK